MAMNRQEAPAGNYVGSYHAQIERRWGWRERLWFRLFPSKYCALPTAPAHYKDVLEIKTTVNLSWDDWLRILVLRRIVVKTRTVTEHTIGGSVSSSVAYVGD